MSPDRVLGGARLESRIDEACRRHRNAAAVSDAVETLSYGDVAEVAGWLADQAIAAGVRPDEPVIVAVSNHARDLAAIVAVWKAGGVVVPLHRSATAQTVFDTVSRTGARFVINACPDDPLTGANPTASHVRQLHGAPPPWRDVLMNAAWVVFTSGSTGRAKGVVHAHDRYLAKLDAINAAMALPTPLRALVPLQLTFAYAQWVCLATLLRGGEIVLASPFRVEAFLRALEDGITAVAVVPTMLRRVRSLTSKRDRPPFRGALISGGEALPADLGGSVRQWWPEVKIWDVYGLTETATSDFYVRPEDYERAAGSIGRPAPGIDFRITPEEQELQIRTPYLMVGYLDAPVSTAAALSEGYFRTGDQARLRSDGCVEITGRLKDLVNRAGNKVAPIEIESAFLRHPDVEDALAAGVPDARHGEGLHIVVVLRRGATVDPEALRVWAAATLEPYKIPDVIHVAAELPIGRTGKADRNALRTLLSASRPLAANEPCRQPRME